MNLSLNDISVTLNLKFTTQNDIDNYIKSVAGISGVDVEKDRYKVYFVGDLIANLHLSKCMVIKKDTISRLITITDKHELDEYIAE